jgi:glycosyltransferase involved in cell wall biosynthesis
MATGRDVFPFDFAAAKQHTVRGAPLDQWRWLLGELKPERVLIVPSDEADDSELLGAANELNLSCTFVDIPGFSAWKPAVSVAFPLSCNIELLRTGIEGNFPRVDVTWLGKANQRAASILLALEQQGHAIAAHGPGWLQWPLLREAAHAMPPDHLVGTLLRSSAVVLCADEFAATEAAAAGTAAVVLDDRSDEEIVEAAQSAIDKPTASALPLDTTTVWNAFFDTTPAEALRVVREGPAVSVLTSAWNIAEYIGPAIESVLDQTFDNFELFVVNDGSPDHSRDVIERYLGDPRVHLVDQQNIGQTGRFDYIWENAARFARGEFVTFLGGDDTYPTNRLADQVRAMRDDPQLDFVHSGGHFTDTRGQRTGYFSFENYDSSTLLRLLLKGNFISHPATMVRSRSLERAGGWGMGFSGDYGMWLTSASWARFRYLPSGLINYRVHEKSASTSSSGVLTASEQALQYRIEAVDRYAISDIYPALSMAVTTNDVDNAAAYVDLGNLLLARLTSAELSQSRWGGVTLETSARCFQHAAELAPDWARTLTDLASKLSSGENYKHGEANLVNPCALSNVPFEIPAEHRHEVISWDGTPISLRRFLVVVDWQHIERARFTLDYYLRRFAGVPDVDLVFLSNGLDDNAALARLATIVPPDIDLETSPSLTLERCDHHKFLAVERYDLVADCRQEIGNTDASLAALFENWLARNRIAVTA